MSLSCQERALQKKGFSFYISSGEIWTTIRPVSGLGVLIASVRGTSTVEINHQSQLLVEHSSARGSSERRMAGARYGGKDAIYAG
jgi:hypothetical protein